MCYFFKQVTADEMRISDWSSDVCSSDLTFFSVTPRPPTRFAEPGRTCSEVIPPASAARKPSSCGHTECSAQTLAVTGAVASLPSLCARAGAGLTAQVRVDVDQPRREDRKSVVRGTGASVRLDLGGRPSIQ